MSMGMVLHGVRDYLRQEYGWDGTKCGVQYQGIPPVNAANFYIGIDDNGVEAGPEDTDALTENCALEIGVWRRSGGKPADRLGGLKLPDDLYLANIYTNTDLERMLIVPSGTAKNHGGLHQNWGLWTYLNTKFSLPNEEIGAGFTGQLVFKGYSRFESIVLPDGNQPAFYGRRIRFRGLRRVQKVRATIG